MALVLAFARELEGLKKTKSYKGWGVRAPKAYRTPNPSLEALVQLTGEVIELRREGRRR